MSGQAELNTGSFLDSWVVRPQYIDMRAETNGVGYLMHSIQ
jgi:hypothetical protein